MSSSSISLGRYLSTYLYGPVSFVGRRPPKRHLAPAWVQLYDVKNELVEISSRNERRLRTLGQNYEK